MRFPNFVLMLLVQSFLLANTFAGQSPVAIEPDTNGIHSSPQKLFAEFSKRHNCGNQSELIPLLSQKTKALLLFSHAHRLGMASREQRNCFKEWEAKWSSSIAEILKDAPVTADADYAQMVLPLSKWDQLDQCIEDVFATDSEIQSTEKLGTPTYNSKLVDLAVNGSQAKGTICIMVNGGLISGLNGNSLEWIKTEPILVHFTKIADRWLVCNEAEYRGAYNR